jgi:hypothetical protein
VLCCAVLCCAVLCCAVLCCAVLCYAVLDCAVLCCAVLCCAALRCAVLYCCVILLLFSFQCQNKKGRAEQTKGEGGEGGRCGTVCVYRHTESPLRVSQPAVHSSVTASTCTPAITQRKQAYGISRHPVNHGARI